MTSTTDPYSAPFRFTPEARLDSRASAVFAPPTPRGLEAVPGVSSPRTGAVGRASFPMAGAPPPGRRSRPPGSRFRPHARSIRATECGIRWLERRIRAVGRASRGHGRPIQSHGPPRRDLGHRIRSPGPALRHTDDTVSGRACQPVTSLRNNRKGLQRRDLRTELEVRPCTCLSETSAHPLVSRKPSR